MSEGLKLDATVVQDPSPLHAVRLMEVEKTPKMGQKQNHRRHLLLYFYTANLFLAVGRISEAIPTAVGSLWVLLLPRGLLQIQINSLPRSSDSNYL